MRPVVSDGTAPYEGAGGIARREGERNPVRVAALGRTQMLYDTIETLHGSGHEVTLVVTCPARPRWREAPPPLDDLAQAIGAPCILVRTLNTPDVIAALIQARAEVAVSIDWPELIGVEACSAFPHGILNAHAGDLPRYRGNSPVGWAILQGEPTIGLTIHQMDPFEFDAGPIALKEYCPVGPSTYVRDVFDFIEGRVPRMFLEAVQRLADGTLTMTPQSASSSPPLRCYPRLPTDGLIDWKQPAEHVCRLVRASSEPYQGAYTTYRGSRLTIWRAKADAWSIQTLAMPGQVTGRDLATGEVAVATGEGALVLQQLEVGESGRCLPVALLKSTRDRLGEADKGDV
jgi:methionyl-tRNA formyltransferase